jgi:(E)-4-hydroxy-3-methylbut-2-enyl-diphosphate synthase
LSNIQDLISANEKLSVRMMEKNLKYPIHIGLTEAGIGLQGVVASSVALAIILNKGLQRVIKFLY